MMTPCCGGTISTVLTPTLTPTLTPDSALTPLPLVCSPPQNKLAKALYDNTAECPDELAFRKGDILRVVDRSAVGTSGWWLCSLHGRQGVAPANRLQLLPPPAPAPGTGAPEWPWS